MRSGGNPNGTKGLIYKLKTIQALVGDCLKFLSQSRNVHTSKPYTARRSLASAPSLNFESNARAFVKRHGRNLTGPKKFVLVLAYLTKGNISKEVSSDAIEQLWSTMRSSSLLGKFNRAFANRAKDNGWVDSKKRGFYNLDRSWKDIFVNE